ncbi:Disintegrin and metalloproteinase domain-containing protein 10 [Orchesella cincta]|uniref:ADAM10 endopeptidase n=1 Tax=Orchesella cincta TaxID=48709 RepID=A0A1D2NK55_ORCCI|nr:Disintegrin and metalloproteinase domain-containing protein 10 [Orchesella cincta]
MWSTFAKFFILILYYSGTCLVILTVLSPHLLSNGSATEEVASGGESPALRYFEPVFYSPSEFISQHRRKKREIRNSESLRLNIASQSRNFRLNLIEDDSVFHPDAVIENSDGPIQYDTSRVLVGHLDDEPGSLAHGVVSEDGFFDGTISTSCGSEYYVEPTKRYSLLNANASQGIIYEKGAIEWPEEPPVCASHELHIKRREERMSSTASTLDPDVRFNSKSNRSDFQHHHHDHHHQHHQSLASINKASFSFPTSKPHKRSKRYIVDPRKRACTLYLQADYLFYRHFGSEEAAINMMARHIQRVNEIYRTTDFDGDGVPDDISFMIKRIKVHTKNHTLDSSYRYNGEFQVIKFLELFSEGDYDQFCLAYMFTFRDFEGGTLGLAWTGDLKNAGGVCERKGHFRGGLKSLNTGIITLLNYGKIVLPAVSFVTLAHEIGHNFGSPHDPEGDKECTPGGREGNYIMYARATAGDQKNNNRFSPCSLRSIIPVLNSKARGTHGCFVEPQQAICGNREVEDGEECDCGWEEDCAEPCCWPMKLRPVRGEKPCTLKYGKDCSPSQGPCCTANCTLKIGDKCRDDNGCRHSAFCDGYMPNCPSSVHKPNKTICHEEQSVCFMGECTGSICLAYGLESCQCTPEPWESTSKYCELCCKLPGEGQPCLSSYQWNEPPFDVPNLYSKPGSPCKNYTGYCDAYHVCREVDPSGPLATLRNLLLADEGLTAIADWIDTHWYAVLCFFVLLILMMVLTAKLCGKRAKQRLRKITVMHSNVEAIQIERSYWDEQGEHVVHPMAVRKKIPIRKKVREKNKTKKRSGSSKNKGDRPGKGVTGTLFKRKGRGERSKVNSNHFANSSSSKTENGELPSNLNGDVQSPTSPIQSFNLVNLQANGGEGACMPPPTGGVPIYPHYMMPDSSTTNGIVGNSKIYNHNSCNNNIPSPGSSSSSGGFRTAQSPRSPITPGDNINDPLCAALVNHEPKTVILPAAGVRRKRSKHPDKKEKKSKQGKSQRSPSKRESSKSASGKNHSHHQPHHPSLQESGGITKRRSVKASTKEQKAAGDAVKPKKRIQVVFTPPFSLRVVQVVAGGGERESHGKSSGNKSSSKQGGGTSASQPTTKHNSGSNNAINSSSSNNANHISNIVKKSESEVPNKSAAAANPISGERANNNISSVKNDLNSCGGGGVKHKLNGANDTQLSASQMKQSCESNNANPISPNKVSNKSANHQKSNKSGKVIKTKISGGGSPDSDNKNVDTGPGSKKESESKIIENLTCSNENEGDGIKGKMGGENKESNKNSQGHIKAKVKSSGSFLQRRKQNLKARAGEKSELRVLIPPCNQDEDDINSPITPMS